MLQLRAVVYSMLERCATQFFTLDVHHSFGGKPSDKVEVLALPQMGRILLHPL